MGINRDAFINEISIALGENKRKPKIIEINEEPIDNLEDIFNVSEKKNEPPKENIKLKEVELPNIITEENKKNINWNVGNESIIKKSLLLGNIENAVKLLFKNNRYCEALLLASTNQELFLKAKEFYFSKEKDLFVKSIFPIIINKNFKFLFDYNITKEWKESLIYVNTYLENQFKNFAEELGDKLCIYNENFPSLICFILAENFEKAMDMLYNSYKKEIENTQDKKELLLKLFDEAYILNQILNKRKYLNKIFNQIIYKYVLLLVQEGLIDEVIKYLIKIKDLGNEYINELYERVYFNCDLKLRNSLPKINHKKILILNQNIKKRKILI